MKQNNEEIEKYRVTKGSMGSDRSIGNNGWFRVKIQTYIINIIVSDQMGWDHVSVTLESTKRTPNWDEMNYVKDLFWSDDETVVQFHPPKSEYVNNHANCLHMWRSQDQEILLPPSIMTGVKGLNPEQVGKIVENQLGARP